MKRVLLLAPYLGPHSGVDAVAVWMIEALKSVYHVTILAWHPVDWPALNRYYGTAVRADEVTVATVPASIRRVVDRVPDAWRFQRHCVLMRWCKWIRHRYDVLIAADNETDFGARGIQYVHHPVQSGNRRRESDPAQPWPRRWATLLRTRLRPWRMISGFSFERMGRNLTLVNSEETGRLFRAAYGGTTSTLRPPFAGDFGSVPWEDREDAFACVGRISPEKRIEEIIDIVAAVRVRHPGIRLHIIGSRVDYEEHYYRRIVEKTQGCDWVSRHENLSRQELVDVLGRVRYGIHARQDEHYGIGVAEMVCAGCIVFVPDGGGQVEIVGDEARLRYRKPDEAVAKVLSVLANPEMQEALRAHLDARKESHATERFQRRLRDIVRAFTDGCELAAAHRAQNRAVDVTFRPGL